MAQELRIETWCDVCLARDGQHEEGQPVEVNGRVIDLCKVDRETLWDPFAAVLIEYGRRPDSAPSAPRPPRPPGAPRTGLKPAGERDHLCLWCPLDYASSGGLGNHLRTVHGIPDGFDLAEVPCPFCGKPSGSTSGMTNHLRIVHEWEGTASGAILAARDDGDPHGAYALVIGQARKLEGAR